jgi:soluble lytic murein transglycosylase-like protein
MKLQDFDLILPVKPKLAKYLPPFYGMLFIILFFPISSTIAGVGKALYFASFYYQVPFKLLIAVADVESSFDPLVINVNGKKVNCLTNAKCIYYQRGTIIKSSSKKVAKKMLKFLHMKGYNYDVGLMQINRLWIEKYNLPPEVFLDANYNALFGAFILRRLLDKYGYPEAIWRYNGKRSYLEKVLQKLKSYEETDK